MVLNYQTRSVLLEDSEVARRKIELAAPKKPRDRLKIAKFCTLLIANVIVIMLVCDIWTSDSKNHSLLGHLKTIWYRLAANSNIVTAISYNTDKPFAIIYGEIVHEGEEVHNCKVLRIYPNAVELRTHGKTIMEKLY